MATKTKTVHNFEGYTQVFGNFAPTDIIEVVKTTSPKKSNTSHAGKAYLKLLALHKEKSEKNEPVTVGDSVAAGNASNRIKWDADPNRDYVRVWRKTS